MINKITFKNYKLFKEKQELELKPLTILIGKNSSGKSSITKLLTLIEGSLNADFEVPFLLENDKVELGGEFRDLLYGRYPTGILEFDIETEENTLSIQIASNTNGGRPKIIRWRLNSGIDLKYDDSIGKYINQNDGTKYNCTFEGFNLKNSIPKTLIEKNNTNLESKEFFLTTNYIGPYRCVPERILNLPLREPNAIKMGKDGKFAYPFLVNDKVNNEGEILGELSRWYKKVFDGWELNIASITSQDYKLELVKENPKMEVNFRDVGQGMIQSLPLVLSSFIPSSNPNSIHIFEQPELHLHPAAHGDLSERFATSTIESHKRYLIETHSKNFVLRLRRLIAEKKLDRNSLVIYYVDYDEENGESILKEINVDEAGEVDYWPEHIFNESLGEVLAIRKAQKLHNL